MRLSAIYPTSVLFAFIALSACNGPGVSAPLTSLSGTSPSASAGGTAAPNLDPNPSPSSGTTDAKRTYQTDAMLFAGNGTWGSEVASLENILDSNHATYRAVSSAELNAMSVDDLANFGVLIFPGGAGGTEAGGLSAQTHANLREAVQSRGVSYVGFCAGSFIAVAPAPAAGQDVSYGLGVVAGPELNYYTLENQGIDIQMTLQSFADGSTADILWYGGPVTPDVKGGVVAKYPDGTPSISEMWSGKGFVILSGGHPTATQAILSSLGLSSSDGLHLDLAWKLISAALNQQALPAF